MVCILRGVKLQLEGGQNTAGRSECLQTEACSLDSRRARRRGGETPGNARSPQPAARICSLDSAAATRVGRRVGLRRRSMVLRRRVRRSAGKAAAMRRRIVPGIAAAAAGVGGGCRGARRKLARRQHFDGRAHVEWRAASVRSFRQRQTWRRPLRARMAFTVPTYKHITD